MLIEFFNIEANVVIIFSLKHDLSILVRIVDNGGRTNRLTQFVANSAPLTDHYDVAHRLSLLSNKIIRTDC